MTLILQKFVSESNKLQYTGNKLKQKGSTSLHDYIGPTSSDATQLNSRHKEREQGRDDQAQECKLMRFQVPNRIVDDSDFKPIYFDRRFRSNWINNDLIESTIAISI